jgi:hypothetical protein
MKLKTNFVIKSQRFDHKVRSPDAACYSTGYTKTIFTTHLTKNRQQLVFGFWFLVVNFVVT